MVVSCVPMYNIFNAGQETINLQGFPSRLFNLRTPSMWNMLAY